MTIVIGILIIGLLVGGAFVAEDDIDN